MYRKGKISYEAGRRNLKGGETRVSSYVCMYICVCASVCAYMCAYMCAYEYMGITCVHMHTYEYMHVYVYVHVYM